MCTSLTHYLADNSSLNKSSIVLSSGETARLHAVLLLYHVLDVSATLSIFGHLALQHN